MEVKDLFFRRYALDVPATLWDSGLPVEFYEGIESLMQAVFGDTGVDSLTSHICAELIWNRPYAVTSMGSFKSALQSRAWYEWLAVVEMIGTFKGARYDDAKWWKGKTETFRSKVNRLFDLRHINWRFDSAGKLVRRVENIAVIECAISASVEGYQTASEHMKKAWDLFNLRPEPDTENSVKEAISAVESAAKVAADDDNATLGDVIKKMNLHPSLGLGISKLYGYCNDEPGIRHGKQSAPDVSLHEAELMLTICAGLVVFLSQMKPTSK
jgi:hypothetical protein